MPDPTAGSRITRPAFVQIPIGLLEHCAERGRKGVLFVYAWLWHYAGKDDNAFPSIQRLALECHMKPDDVRLALRFLVEQGWVHREDRPGATSVFHVRMEALAHGTPPPSGGSPKQGTPPPSGGPHPSPKWGTPPLPQMGGGNKKERTRRTEQEKNPPNPPAGGKPPKAAGRTRAKRAQEPAVDPATAELPALLEPYRSQITRFWNEHKGGVKTAGAWTFLVGQLQRIEAEAPGALPGQFEAAEARAVNKAKPPFESITYANWSRYGRETRATGNGSQQPFLSGSRQADNAARAIARLKQAKPNDALAALIAKQDAQLAAMAQPKAITVEVLP